MRSILKSDLKELNSAILCRPLALTFVMQLSGLSGISLILRYFFRCFYSAAAIRTRADIGKHKIIQQNTKPNISSKVSQYRTSPSIIIESIIQQNSTVHGALTQNSLNIRGAGRSPEVLVESTHGWTRCWCVRRLLVMLMTFEKSGWLAARIWPDALWMLCPAWCVDN